MHEDQNEDKQVYPVKQWTKVKDEDRSTPVTLNY